jgi:hypothetical protein
VQSDDNSAGSISGLHSAWQQPDVRGCGHCSQQADSEAIMKRREFITFPAAQAAEWPLRARPQQSAARIGLPLTQDGNDRETA